MALTPISMHEYDSPFSRLCKLPFYYKLFIVNICKQLFSLLFLFYYLCHPSQNWNIISSTNQHHRTKRIPPKLNRESKMADNSAEGDNEAAKKGSSSESSDVSIEKLNPEESDINIGGKLAEDPNKVRSMAGKTYVPRMLTYSIFCNLKLILGEFY